VNIICRENFYSILFADAEKKSITTRKQAESLKVANSKDDFDGGLMLVLMLVM